MKDIKVLGTGCANCSKSTLRLIEETAKAMGVEVRIDNVEDPREFARYGVMSTPCVIIDNDVVHAGGVPSRESVERWLKAG